MKKSPVTTTKPAAVAAEEVKSLRQAAEQGDSEARLKLGNAYRLGEGVDKDLTEAAKWFRLAAEQGHAEAQFHLGQGYYFSEGVKKDLTEGVKWFRLAEEKYRFFKKMSRDGMKRY